MTDIDTIEYSKKKPE